MGTMNKTRRNPVARSEAEMPEETPPVPQPMPSAPVAPQMTIDRFVLVTKGDKSHVLINSFATCERIARGATRKLTSDEWRAAFVEWCGKTRI